MFENIKNTIDFFIRNKTKFSRKNFVEKNPDLIKRNEQENLYTFDILNQFFIKKQKQTLKVLDIGSKNWFYAKGEYDYFKSFSNDFELIGVELDAYRLYGNLYSRFEVAKYHIKSLKNVKYIADNVLNIQDKFDYIIWFLPFVTIKPHMFWGLPKKYYMPEKLLLHAYSLLEQNGQMLIINQGQKESQIQKEMFEKLNISYTVLNKIESEHFQYMNERYGYLVVKN